MMVHMRNDCCWRIVVECSLYPVLYTHATLHWPGASWPACYCCRVSGKSFPTVISLIWEHFEMSDVFALIAFQPGYCWGTGTWGLCGDVDQAVCRGLQVYTGPGALIPSSGRCLSSNPEPGGLLHIPYPSYTTGRIQSCWEKLLRSVGSCCKVRTTLDSHAGIWYGCSDLR